jgi:phenylpropionate dioxygenase-like ring-hydroxylating dioxygenase large terminal subunit
MLSSELAAGEVKPLRYFGCDLVIWRGDDGVPRMLDAHCPRAG